MKQGKSVKKLRCGTRGSQLALAQTKLVIDALHQVHPALQIEQIEIKTLGDRKQGTPQASRSDKKDWVYELELALLNNQIDFAVHSGKDIPYAIEPGTALLPVLKRAKPFDAFVGRKMADGKRLRFDDVPKGGKVGTASLRRKGCLLKMRPDLNVVEHRGNVPTRLQKLDESHDLMGIVLACAGIDRLGKNDLHYEILDNERMLPALNQGTLVVQFRVDDRVARTLLDSLVDKETYVTWLAERTVAEILKGDCHSAIAIFGECMKERLVLTAQVMLPNGQEVVQANEQGSLEEAISIGQRVGNRLLELGADQIIKKSKGDLWPI